MFDKPAEPPKKPSLFDNIKSSVVVVPPAAKTNLFGENKLSSTASEASPSQRAKAEIVLWVSENGIKTTANRIEFILGNADISKVNGMQVGDIGKYQVEQATEANKCVDQVVTDYARLKTTLETPKQLILDAIGAIEGGSRPLTFFERIKGATPVDWAVLRRFVKNNIDEANLKMNSAVKYHLEPFISGLDDAKNTLSQIVRDLENTISALDYVIVKKTDPTIQDLARRRKEMFAKSLALMQLNNGQIDSMRMACEKNKMFATELEMNLKPLIENVMRSALINDSDSQTAMQDIQTKLKGLL